MSSGAAQCDRPFHWRIRLPSLLLPAFIILIFACALAPQSAWPDVPFKNEFDEICSRTTEAESMPVRELEALIARCDKLQPAIEKAGEPERKIYLKRLRMCRDLFLYVLESKKAAATADK